MKTALSAPLLCLLITCAFLTSCKSSADKVDDAELKVVEANENLENANNAHLAEVALYKKEISDKIALNQRSIDDFNNRKAVDKLVAKEEYRNKVIELEQKNSDMKKRLDDYKSDSKESWEIFKTEFNHDLDELGNSFKDFFSKSN